MAYAMGDTIDGPVTCPGCGEAKPEVQVVGWDDNGRCTWRCHTCVKNAASNSNVTCNVELDKPPVPVVKSRQTKTPATSGNTRKVTVMTTTAGVQVTGAFALNKETDNAYRLGGVDKTGVYGSLYIPKDQFPPGAVKATVTVVFEQAEG